MFLDDIVGVASRAIFRYPDVVSYLSSRGVTDEEVLKYHIGYLRVLGVPDDGSRDRSIFMESSLNGKKFEKKIIFPLRGSMGNVLGIIGRSPTSKAFKIYATEEAKQTGFFFGLFEALPSIYERNRAFVVEGPFDTLSLAKICPNTVGALTAGINNLQYDLLKMYCDTIVTVFDSDGAGQRAAREAAAEHGDIWNLELGFKDPSNCLATLSEEGFRKHVHRKLKEIPSF